ncbi:heme-copper oxidase subunit III [Nakamurella silvestris]|nr:heme-copper oxidase subunit III [Nakamurella silvestris]
MPSRPAGPGPAQASVPPTVHNHPVTTVTNSNPGTPTGPANLSTRIHTLNRPNMVSVGTVVWLASELMFFAGLFGIYFTARATNPPEREWPLHELNVPYALVFTIILVASSFTCQLGVFAAERGDVFGLRRWYTVTLILGAIFVGGQANEYINLVHEGMTFSSDVYGTVFYLTTGFHGLHVIGGLVAFVLLIARTKLSKFTPAQATSAIVVSYYWHFVDVVWIALFATIYFVR